MNIRYGAAPSQDISVQDIEMHADYLRRMNLLVALKVVTNISSPKVVLIYLEVNANVFAMARALVRKPDLFIFDDSFSALDGTTERAVRTVLHEELQKDNRPALISVEQKVSAAKKADHILIIKQRSSGRVWHS